MENILTIRIKPYNIQRTYGLNKLYWVKDDESGLPFQLHGVKKNLSVCPGM